MAVTEIGDTTAKTFAECVPLSLPSALRFDALTLFAP